MGVVLLLRSELVVQWLAVTLRVIPSVFHERHFVVCGEACVVCDQLNQSTLFFPPLPMNCHPVIT